MIAPPWACPDASGFQSGVSHRDGLGLAAYTVSCASDMDSGWMIPANQSRKRHTPNAAGQAHFGDLADAAGLQGWCFWLNCEQA